MFFSKLSYGIAAAFVVVAGTVNLPIKKFIKYGVTVTILQYGVLLVLGYFLGAAFGGTIEKLLSAIQYVLLALAVAAIGYIFFTRYMRRRLEKEEKKASLEHETEA